MHLPLEGHSGATGEASLPAAKSARTPCDFFPSAAVPAAGEGGAGGGSSGHPRNVSTFASILSIPHASAAPGASLAAVPASLAQHGELTVMVAQLITKEEVAGLKGYRFRMPNRPMNASFPSLIEKK